ncbi:MAG: hemolysin family protein [bacterium]
MSTLLCLAGLVASYLSAYLVSLYSLAVYIDPDEVEQLFPGLPRKRQRFLARLHEDPRVFRQLAMIYKAFVAVVGTGLVLCLASNLQPYLTDHPAPIYVLAIILFWMLHITVVEYLPRRSSRNAINERMLRHLWLIRIVYRIFMPAARVYRGSLGRVQPRTDVTEEEREEIVERAIETLADDAGIKEAIVEEDEKEMIGQIFLLDQTTVREIMIPRIDITGIERTMSFKQIKDLVYRDGHSRYPVYDQVIDKIIGLIYVKDIFNNMPEPGEVFNIDRYLRRPFNVPETKIIGQLLKEFKLRRQHIAMVVDEYGGVAGLVTLEDIIEEIFGEIQDEHDAEEAEIEHLPDGCYRVSAALMVEKLQDQLDTDYEAGDYDTVGGLIYDLVGSVPHEGQIVKWHGLEFEVESVDGQRIKSVLVRV